MECHGPVSGDGQRTLTVSIEAENLKNKNDHSEGVDSTLARLQDVVDIFLARENIPVSHHPQWRTRRTEGRNGYSDWEQESPADGSDTILSFLENAGIKLEAGWAFGNGSHPTTAGCARAIMHLSDTDMIRGKKALDIGTGTGVLALMMAVLGASSIIALDIDPESAKIATCNVKQNGLDKQIAVYGISLSELRPFTPDIITANLAPSVMQGLFRQMSCYIGDTTLIVAGGFKKARQADMNRMFEQAGCHPCWSADIAGWSTVIYKKI